MEKTIALSWKMPERPECFYGREKELAQLHNYLNMENHTVFVQGIGGIGKSELVAQYAILNRVDYDVILFANCISDIRTMISSDVEFPVEHVKRNTLDEYNLETEEEYFKRKFAILKSIVTEKTLLIVDNFNNEDDEYLEEFLQLNCYKIFTSRLDWSKKQYSVLQVGEIENYQDIEKIFMHYYVPQTEEETGKIHEIVQLVNGYTLAVEWIAKHLSGHLITVSEMLESLQQKKIEDARIFQSNKALFHMLLDVFQIKNLEQDELEVLQFLCLVPYTGIVKEELVRIGGDGTHAAVLKLLGSSWMKHVELGVVALHPVVAETVLAELRPDWEDMKRYADNMAKDLLDDDLPLCQVDAILQIAENMFRILGVEEPGAVTLLMGVAHCFIKRYHKYPVAIGLLEQSLKLQQQAIAQIKVKITLCKEQNSMDIQYTQLKKQILEQETVRSLIIHQIGEIYFINGQYEKALNYYMKLNGSPVADVYCDIAKVYAKVKEYKKAMQYIQAGIKMKKRKYGADEIPLVENYLLLASLYIDNDDFRMARQWMNEAEQIATKQMTERQKADFYYQYAILLKNMGQIEEALSYDQKVCTLYLHLYGENHMSVIHAYAAMAVDYYRLADYVSALQCTLKEIVLRKRVRRIKKKLYLSVSRLIGMIDVNALEEETKAELRAFMSDFNRMLKENPEEGEEMLRQ